MGTQRPILSAPQGASVLNIGSSQVVQRIRSAQTNGAFSVVEFVSQPGEGVAPHVHANEEELVYLLEGRIEVTLGGQTMSIPQGACALLPRGIPHGYINTGDSPSRLLAVLMPGGLDEFFEALDQELGTDRAHEEAVSRLCERFGLQFVEPAGA